MSTGPPIIEAVAVAKKFGNVTAVDNLTLAVPAGVCFGLLGPNGAGKTTLIEIIEDIIEPTSGQVYFKGQPRTSAFREQIGIMFQQTALLSFMTVAETLTIFQSLYSDTEDAETLIELCHLGEIRNQLNDKISGGQRQRLLLALALINRPHLLFLDEPSTGLDPQARRNLWDIITAVKHKGNTIILTTHYMEEAQQMCDQIAIIDHGRIIAQGSPQQLIDQYTHGLSVTVPKENFDRSGVTPPRGAKLHGGRIAMEVNDINRAVAKLLEAGVDLTHMSIQTPDLETVFLNLTGRGLRD